MRGMDPGIVTILCILGVLLGLSLVLLWRFV